MQYWPAELSLQLCSVHVILSDLFRERFLVSLSGVRGEKGEEREGRRWRGEYETSTASNYQW